MATEYSTIQHRWFDQVWNLGNREEIDELLHPEVIGHGLVDAEGNTIEGVEAFKTFYDSFRAAFPDIRVEIEDCIDDGDRCVVRCLVTATHLGQGFFGEPTGKPIAFSGMCWVRVEDGQIVESWNSFDFLTVIQQLGLSD
ncbi:MAG: ester cyclase [Fimbriimonadaceae bacterium]